ncbi:MAG: hypothetical protein GY822_10185, partial [Deltaproteobacteria bacterium]|nr:hypothetical protein [Deltaproteobacteria bacterium]
MNIVLSDALFDSLLRIGKMPAIERVLVISETDLPSIERFKSLRKKLIFAVERAHVASALEAEAHQVVHLPGFTATRTDRLKAALVGAIGSGFLSVGEEVLIGSFHQDPPCMDSLLLLTVDDEQDDHSSLAVAAISQKLPPQLMEVIVNLALRIGQQGYEGYALGALFVVGKHTDVMERSHPLTMNPFQGYSEAERNIFDPVVRDAVRTFAMLDGAFVIREDGVVLCAGRHIQVSQAVEGLPLGMGARHAAAASITSETDAVAVVVSQSSGAVRVFNEGSLELQIMPAGRRGDDHKQETDEVKLFGDVAKKKLVSKAQAEKKSGVKSNEKKSGEKKSGEKKSGEKKS